MATEGADEVSFFAEYGCGIGTDVPRQQQPPLRVVEDMVCVCRSTKRIRCPTQ